MRSGNFSGKGSFTPGLILSSLVVIAGVKAKSVKPEKEVVMVRFSAEDDLALLRSIFSHREKATDRDSNVWTVVAEEMAEFSQKFIFEEVEEKEKAAHGLREEVESRRNSGKVLSFFHCANSR